ncbi:MAG: hypothetical protein HY550_00665, partial [Elusimicrobia bacterium]|nr:hypothetical protein [Elusimicrobiota bacterium]
SLTNLTAANIDAGNLGALVKASSVAISAFYSSGDIRTNLGLAIGTDVLAPAGSGASLTNLTAANIDAGALGAAVTHKMGAGAGAAYSVGVASAITGSMPTSGTIEEVLLSYSLPANSLSADAKGIKIRAWGTTDADANVKTIKLKFGGTILVTNDQTGSPVSSTWEFEAMVFRTAASAQEAIGKGIVAAANQTVTKSLPAEDTTGAISIAITGETPTQAGDLTAEGLVVEFMN